MRTLNAVGVEASILTAYHVWPIGCALVLTGLVRLVHGLLVEHMRRRTLEMLCERAPEGTLIIQEQGSGVPGMAVEIGGSVRRNERSVDLPGGPWAGRELIGREQQDRE